MARETKITLYRKYFDGDVTAMYHGFYDRFGKSDKAVADRVQQTDVPIKNYLREALLKRMALVPTSTIAFEVMKNDVLDEKLTDWTTAWTQGRNFDNKIFVSWSDEALKDMVVDGEVPVKMILVGGIPQARIIDDLKFSITTSIDNIFSVLAYTAEYTIENEGAVNTETTIIKESITESRYIMTQDGAELPEPYTVDHSYPFIPLVHIVRELRKGETHGRSGLVDLIEPQNNIIRCATTTARANKFGGWGLFALKDYSAQSPDTIPLEPGSLVGAAIERISASGADQSLFDEEDKYIDSLYALAGVKRMTRDEMASAPNQSGKAIQTLTAEGKRQVDSDISALKSGFEQMVTYALVMANEIQDIDDVRVNCIFEDLYTEDPQAKLERAKWLDSIGLTSEALKVIGYDETSIESLMVERVDDMPTFEPAEIEETKEP